MSTDDWILLYEGSTTRWLQIASKNNNNKTSLSEVVSYDNSNIIYIKGDSACFFLKEERIKIFFDFISRLMLSFLCCFQMCDCVGECVHTVFRDLLERINNEGQTKPETAVCFFFFLLL